VTKGLIVSTVFILMPGTLARSSTDPKGPLVSRYLTIAAAFAAPMPLTALSNCWAVAVLISSACAKLTAAHNASANPSMIFNNFIGILLLGLAIRPMEPEPEKPSK